MIKHILVPTDGSPAAEAGVRFAATFATKYQATVRGLHVVDIKLLEGPFLRDISASLGTAPYVNYQGNIAMILEERGKTALQSVEKICANAGVECNTELITGLVVGAIVEQGELTDLIILGRSGEHSEWLDGLIGSTAGAVVRRSTRPVLITGRETPGHELFVAAYDGSGHARAALHVAAEVTRDWGAALRVLVVGEGERAAAWAQEAQSYLEPYELDAHSVVRNGDSSETIVAYAEETKADMLIMGAYGHKKMRRLVVGSTTAYAMNHSPCPLLLTR
ncbi:MAG: universal stress protein [Candidatus Hydrogenedentota bacterium]